jgi:hypothetical protein
MRSLFITEELEWLILALDLFPLKDAVYAIHPRVFACVFGILTLARYALAPRMGFPGVDGDLRLGVDLPNDARCARGKRMAQLAWSLWKRHESVSQTTHLMDR